MDILQQQLIFWPWFETQYNGYQQIDNTKYNEITSKIFSFDYNGCPSIINQTSKMVTDIPTIDPTTDPTYYPSINPTIDPTFNPTLPTINPTKATQFPTIVTELDTEKEEKKSCIVQQF